MSDEKIENIGQLLNQAGYTLADLIRESSRTNSKLLMMTDENRDKCIEIYDIIKNGSLSSGTKGKKLEELTYILFNKSVENVFDVYRNCKTSTNEIDLMIRWTENARLAGINSAFPCFGESFLCECKNYKGPVDVTYVGKFGHLMTISNVDFGIMVSWKGISGKTKWDAAKGLIKKFALHENKYIVVIDKDDIFEICEKKKSIFSLIYDKYMALKLEIDYSTYLKKHGAEDILL